MIHLSDSVWYEYPLDVTYIISCNYLIDWVLIALLSPRFGKTSRFLASVQLLCYHLV